MTQQDDITQRLNEIHADAGYLFGRVAADGACAGAMAESVRARIDAIKALLSKLRAPVAESTDRSMLQSVLQDLEKSESVCPRCGYGDSCADMDVAHMIRDHLKGDASAPVAGEAQPVAVTDHQGDVHWGHGRKAGIALYAAPQASAEDVTRDLVALVVKLARSIRKSDPAMYGMALDFLKRHNLQGSPLRGESTTPPTGPTQAQCKAAAEIARGFGARHLADVLDPPQADKDGGQQRAGDAERWRWATATDENAQMLCTIVQAYGGDQQKINERADFYRAALSATQAEQGERDA
ncbi:hypothetical protein ACOTCJ_25915 [Achromobacter xylosoxidans]|uniref:hypothetical protein n=1 Tax=Alcaligenes xylosoxydans xylosoxydans TaxID=85698 RepID=UPI001EEDF6F3|nr:hypothetical protein [Achromobacter xylosoxidans]